MIRQRVNAGLSAIKAKIKRDGHFTTKAGIVRRCVGVSHAVKRNAGSLNHLRLGLLVLVSAEKRILDEIALIARDVSCHPDGIENLQISLCDEDVC